MSNLKNISSVEAYEVAEAAKKKGLVLLEGHYYWSSAAYYFPLEEYHKDYDQKGYAVSKIIADQYLTLEYDGSIYQDYVEDYFLTLREKPYFFRDVRFNLTLEEAKARIDSFNGEIKNFPKFYGYIRVYKGEPAFYAQLQLMCLEDFARKHKISYEDFIICVGEEPETEEYRHGKIRLNDIVERFKPIFSKITGNDFLVAADNSRFDYDSSEWLKEFNTIVVNTKLEEYATWGYQESEKAKQAKCEQVLFYEKPKETMEYSKMCREYQEMQLLDEQPFIPQEEEEDTYYYESSTQEEA